jgi:hypothetical protein
MFNKKDRLQREFEQEQSSAEATGIDILNKAHHKRKVL